MQGNIFLTPSKASQSQSLSQSKKKSQKFKLQLRRQNIDEFFNKVRKQLISQSKEIDPNFQLRNVDLIADLELLKNVKVQDHEDRQKIELIISHIFIYASSQKIHHLSNLLDNSHISQIINIIYCQIQKSQENELPLLENKAFWILVNLTYCRCDDEFASQFMGLSEKIWDFCFNCLEHEISQNQKLPNLILIKQKKLLNYLLIGVKNLASNSLQFIKEKLVVVVEGKSCSFLSKILKEVTDLGSIKLESTSIEHCELILTNSYKLIEDIAVYENYFFSLPESITIVQMLISHYKIFQGYDSIEYGITEALRVILLMNIIERPNIVLQFNWEDLLPFLHLKVDRYLKINYELIHFSSMMQEEGRPKTVSKLTLNLSRQEKLILSLLSIVKVFYGLNIPNDLDSNNYYKLYKRWLEVYIMQSFTNLLKNHAPPARKIHQQILKILSDICLEEMFTEIVIEDLSMMSQLFYYGQNENQQEFRIRISALHVLANMVKISVYQGSDTKQTTLEIFLKNHYLRLIYYNIDYQQEDITNELIQTLAIIIHPDNYSSQYRDVYAEFFVDLDGKKKLVQIIQNHQGNLQLHAFIEEALKHYQQYFEQQQQVEFQFS